MLSTHLFTHKTHNSFNLAEIGPGSHRFLDNFSFLTDSRSRRYPLPPSRRRRGCFWYASTHDQSMKDILWFATYVPDALINAVLCTQFSAKIIDTRIDKILSYFVTK